VLGHLFIHVGAEEAVNPLVKASLLLVCLASLVWAGQTAEQLFKEGQKAERAGQTVRAYLLYAEAAAADPTSVIYWERAQALRPIASLLKTEQSKPADLTPEKIDRTLFGSISPEDLDRARKPLPPAEMKAAPGKQDFDLRGDSKTLWEQVAKAYNLNVIFDTQYQPGRPIRFQIAEADYRDALRLLEAATDSFLVPVSQRLIFVANDTTQKRNDFESTAAVVIPFPEVMSVQELQEIATGVRGTLDIQKLMVDSQRHLILIRDRVTKVRLAQKIFEDLLRPHAQVAIEIEILSTARTSALAYGIDLQTAFPLVLFSSKPNVLSAIPSGFTNFAKIAGGGATLLGLGLTTASLFATVAKSNSDSLLQSEVVALDGTATSFHVGDKYPVQNNAYIGTNTGSGQVFAPPPSFTFEDLGLVLKVTPHIHGVDDVTLDVSAEFKLLGAGSVNGIPIISSRKVESKVRLMTGEWAVLAGLMS